MKILTGRMEDKMGSTKEYILVSCDDLELFEDRCSSCMNNGYVPLGGVVVVVKKGGILYDYNYCQSFIIDRRFPPEEE